MMNFKDHLLKDMHTFINISEFAVIAEIEGSNVNVVIDNDTLKEYQLKNGGEGLINDGLLFHVKKSEMPFIPIPGQDIMFNNSYYFIEDVVENDGLYTITLEVRDS